MKLSDFSKNIYSKFGEDGIIEKIFSIINTESKVCVEFGAWDGIHLSNTANLWNNFNWKAILIEGDPGKIKPINHPNVTFINSFIDIIGNTIDFILTSNNIFEIDFMSIDIDGNDYYILEGLICKPKVLSVEFNASIPFWIDCYQEQNGKFGASLAAITRLGKAKGYSLISVTDTNAFLVLDELYPLFSSYNTNYNDIACTNHYCSIITDYSGNHKLIGSLLGNPISDISNSTENIILGIK